MRTLLNAIIRRLVEYCKNSGRVYHITGDPNDKEDVYLVRYIVFKSKWMCFYIHRFMRSDSSDPHDHPWNFFTYIVSGGYEEHFYNKAKPELKYVEKYRQYGMPNVKAYFKAFWTKSVNVRKSGSLAYRKATSIHRVVIDRRYRLKDIEKAPLTACIMFNRIRDWGFWPLKDKGAKFVDWRSYLKIKPGDPRIEGSE